MKKNILTLFALIAMQWLVAQQNTVPRINRFIDITGAVGSSEGTTSVSYIRNWQLGKHKKLEMGLGLRTTAYFGKKKEYYTAPARLSRSTTVPFIIVFAGHQDQNTDTLTIQRPVTLSLNLSANFGYSFSARWYGGINIDLIGFTVGRNSSATLQSNGLTTAEPAAKPTGFNILLTGDNDYGSLNSEFFLKYAITKRWKLKAAYQFYFSEYKTQTIKQIAPDGTSVYRFRNKVNALGIGIAYAL